MDVGDVKIDMIHKKLLRLCIIIVLTTVCLSACRRKPNNGPSITTDGNAMTGQSEIIQSVTINTEGTQGDESVHTFPANAATVPAQNEQETKETQHIHYYSQWTDSKDGNTHSRICMCGKAETEKHNFNEGVTTPATHTTDGSREYICTQCGTKKSEKLPANKDNHSYGQWEECDKEYHIRKCACGDEIKGKHTWQKDYEKSSDQETAYDCFCGAYKKEIRTEFKYVCYWAKYLVTENHTGTYFAESKEGVLNGIIDLGGTLVDDVQYSEKITQEYKGSYFSEGDLYYFLVDKE